jgi:hypothetical protein
VNPGAEEKPAHFIRLVVDFEDGYPTENEARLAAGILSNNIKYGFPHNYLRITTEIDNKEEARP